MSTTALAERLIRVRVARRTKAAEGIACFELEPLAQALQPYEPGAHIDVQVPGGPIRQYSLCGPATATAGYQIAVLRDPASRGGSAWLHEHVRLGSTLEIGPPRNHFPLREDAVRSLLFAGGIGITPLIAMADRLAARGAEFTLHYATRSAARTAFAQRLREGPCAERVHFHHDDGDAAQKLDIAATLAAPQPGTHVYVCGPSGFLDSVRSTARGQGWPDAQVHFEYFAGQAVHDARDRGFDLVLHKSGRTIRVQADQTCVEALAAAGINVPTSCEQGVCGTCLTPVRAGEVEHKDLFLSPEEQAAHDQFLPCCSRAKSARLVIDL